MSIVDDVLRIIRQHDLIAPDTTVVVGVSGGADSLCLLHVLRRLSVTLGCRLHVATLDHQLRGQAGGGDARFVERMAREWHLPVTAGLVDVPSLAREQRMGIEAAARQARYDFLASVAVQVDADSVAVAHHADDQAETILLHLLRGTGVQGLSGMSLHAALPGHPTIPVIRPLLLVTRAQIEAYCREQGLRPREDATNRDMIYLRNYIRSHTIPHLREVNPRIERVLSQLGEIAVVEQDYLNQQLARAIADHVMQTPRRALIDRQVFRELHPALQRRFIRWAAQELAGSTENLFYENITAAAGVGARGDVGAVALLPGGLRLRVDYLTVAIEHADSPLESDGYWLGPEQVISVDIPGAARVQAEDVTAEWELVTSTRPISGYDARLVIPEGSRVVLRTRRRGDVFAPLGLGGHTQKLSKWMIDHKLPHHLRDRTPLIVVEGVIAAIIDGSRWTVSEQFAVSGGDEVVGYFHARKILKRLM